MKDILILFILKISRNLFWHKTFKMRTGIAKGFKRRFGLGFKPKFNLTKEEIFLMSLNLKKQTIFDIGGYIGLHSIFFAHATGKEGKVITFEPNPVNYREILFNIKLNNLKNITVFPIGIGKEESELELIVDPIYFSRSTFDNIEKKSNKKQILKHFNVKINSIDNLMKKKNLPKPDFIKIDVEGFENNVIQGMVNLINDYKPDLFIEIHKNIENEMIKPLIRNDYLFYHIELRKKILTERINEISDGHLFCYKYNKAINQ